MNKNVALKNNRKEILLLNILLSVAAEACKEIAGEVLYMQWMMYLVSGKRPKNENKVPQGKNGEDGVNWYVYVGNDPVNFVDPLGLLNVALPAVDMHNSNWSSEQLGNSDDKKETIGTEGCYTSGFSSVVTKLTCKKETPRTINAKKTNYYDNSASINRDQAAANYGLQADYWTKKVQGDLGKKIDELNNSSTDYGILAQVPHNDVGDLHWVELSGGTRTVGDITYVEVAGTSKYDCQIAKRPDSWKYVNDKVFVPTSVIKQIDTFTKLKNKYVPISDIQQNDTFTKLKNK